MQQKSQVMRLAMGGGITDLNQIRQLYDQSQQLQDGGKARYKSGKHDLQNPVVEVHDRYYIGPAGGEVRPFSGKYVQYIPGVAAVGNGLTAVFEPTKENIYRVGTSIGSDIATVLMGGFGKAVSAPFQYGMTVNGILGNPKEPVVNYGSSIPGLRDPRGYVNIPSEWHAKQEGGPIGKPSLNEYLAKRAADEQVEYYLEGSRNRTELPQIKVPVTKEHKDIARKKLAEEKNYQIGLIRGLSESAGIPIYQAHRLLTEGTYPLEWNGEYDYWFNSYQYSKKDENDYKQALNEKYIDGANCLLTATSNNPNPGHVESGNQTFRKNPGKYGWREVSKSEIRPGGLIQMNMGKDYPNHAVILDNIGDNGDFYVNYSDGGGKYNRNKRLWADDNYYYNFVGNSADSLRWINDYNNLYGTEYSKGGGIHIKKSHRGRLTELKKRTGKTEAELWKTGNAATRKMITFARNARKWKHDQGGYLDEIIWDNMGQWKYPCMVTGITGTRNGTDITMRGVGDPLFAYDNLGNGGLLLPGQDYHFAGSRVVEYPLTYQYGGLIKPFSYIQIPIVRYQNGGGFRNKIIHTLIPSVQEFTERHPEYIQLIPQQIKRLVVPGLINGENVIHDNRISNDSILALNEQREFIHNVENPINRNYDSITQRYYAYPAIEDNGQTYDIGDGLKLSANPGVLSIYNSQIDDNGKHYLTKHQHDSLVMDRLGRDYSISKNTYNDYIGNQFGVENPWDDLNYREKSLLMDYQYNVKGGLGKFKNLMTAMYNGDVDTIKEESKRYQRKGGKKYELGRNKFILDRIDSMYPDNVVDFGVQQN